MLGFGVEFVTVEREGPVLGERPVPGGRPDVEARGRGGTIDAMNAPAGLPPRIQVPRWVQLVGLPLVLVLAWIVASKAAHVVVLFVVAALIALLLDPLVRGLGRLGLRRGFATALVYLTFIAALVVAIGAIATAIVGQTKSAANRFNDYFTVQHGRNGQTSADRDVDRLQLWLNTHHLRSIKIQASGHRIVKRI